MTPNREFINKRLGGADAVWNRLRYDRDGIIEASAGTGKTYALQSIVLKLVSDESRPVDIKNILLVTYTEKAAGELKDRIRAILQEACCLPPDFDETTICTIHSFCRELLTAYAFENRVPMEMEIGSSNKDLIHRAVRAALLGDEFKERYGEKYAAFMEAGEFESTNELVAAAVKKLDDCAKKGDAPSVAQGDGSNKASVLLDGLVMLAWPVFNRLKDESATLSFDDLVIRASRVIEEEAAREASGVHSALLDAIRRRYRIALVDEFQDTDKMQWGIFRNVFSAKVNRLEGKDVPNPKQGFLLVVGDPKQAIYSFRGANVETYLLAKDAITVGEGTQPPQTLSATYRSTRELVTGFNAIFGAASGWFNDMVEGSRRIAYADVHYPEGNARFARLEDLTGRPAVNLLEALPCKLPDPVNGTAGYGNREKCLPVFLENAAREMKRLHDLPVAYRTFDEKTNAMVEHRFGYGDMCVLTRNGKADAKMVKRTLTRFGIPYAHYKERGLFATEEAEALLALFDFLSAPSRNGNLAALLLTTFFNVPPTDLEARLASGDRAFTELVEKWQELAKRRNWNRLFESVMEDTALAHPATNDCEYDRRWAAMRQMLDKLLAAKGRSALVIDEFAELLRSWRKIDTQAGDDGSLRQKESEGDCVQIMTMHASKGLEFGVVFVAAGMDQGRQNDVNEIKRLFYVALTRAEHKLYLPWTKWSPHRRAKRNKGKEVLQEEYGLGSKNSFLLDRGCLSRGIMTLFKDPVVVDLGMTAGNGLPAQSDAAETDGCVAASAPVAIPKSYDIGYLKNRTMQWDSFSSLSGHGKSLSAVPDASAESDEMRIPGARPKTLLPRTNVSGTVFHEVMEALCGNDEASGDIGFAIGKLALDEALSDESFAEIVRRAMRRNALGNQMAEGDSTERTLMRMVWNALNTAITIGGRTFFLKDVPVADRRAEVEFVLDEKTALGADLPSLGGRPRDGVFNGSIDLLIRPDGAGGPAYILDWKTNTLDGYGDESVEAAMESAGYPLQFKLYSLAASQWLGADSIAGVAYLFVRGGEQLGGRSGVYARAMDDVQMPDCRKAVLAALPNSATGR